MNIDGKSSVYERSDVVSFYKGQSNLQPCEAYLFDKYVKPGMAILDMGVGGGRTTPHLARIAGRYVGADYSQAMVDACRERFQSLTFRLCDATDLAQFGDCDFDVVVFSFNGIDYILNDVARARCLAETERVLKPGGLFIFSSHNAVQLALWPLFTGARPHQVLWRIARSVVKSVSIARRVLASGAFFAGEGYIRDPVHGGMYTYVSTPDALAPQLAAAGLEIVETVGGHYPTVRIAALTPWNYYACRKPSQV